MLTRFLQLLSFFVVMAHYQVRVVNKEEFGAAHNDLSGWEAHTHKVQRCTPKQNRKFKWDYESVPTGIAIRKSIFAQVILYINVRI